MAIRFDNIEAINLLNNQGEQTIALTNDQGIIVSGNVAMITGNSTGKFAVMATGVHASYDFYNNGTSYFNGGVVIDAGLSQTGGADASFSGNVTLSSTAPVLYLANTTSSTGKTWRFSSAANGNAYITQDGVIDAITLSHTSGNATFAGSLSALRGVEVRDSDGSTTLSHGRLMSNGTEGFLTVSNGSNWGFIVRGPANDPRIGAWYGGVLKIEGFHSSDGATGSNAIDFARFDFGNNNFQMNAATSTFAGKINAKGGASISGFTAATINAYTATVSSNLFSALRIVENSAASTYWDIGATGGSSPDLKFFVNAGTTPKFTLSASGNATFAGDITTGGDINVPEYVVHDGDTNTHIRFTADRIRLVAGGTVKFDSNSPYITGVDWTEIAGDAANINVSGFNNDAGYLTSSHNHDDRYYTETEIDAKFTSSNGTEDEFKFTLGDEGNLSGNKWYKVAHVNTGNGGLHIKGSLSNHVESFGSQKVDLLIQGREADDGDEIEITGTVDVLHNATGTGTDKAGIRVIKSAVGTNYDTYTIYIRTTRYSLAKFHLTKFGTTAFYTSKPSVTSEPAPVSGGNVELDTSTLTEGHYVIVDSAAKLSVGSDITLNGFGAGYLKTNVNGVISNTTTIPWSTVSSTPTTISGYGITDALAIGTTATTALAGNTTIPSGNAVIDWTTDQGSTNIHSGNYSNTQLSNAEVISAVVASNSIDNADKGTIRSNIGAGTSSLAIGTTASTAMAGNTLSAQDLTDIGNLSGTNTGDQDLSSFITSQRAISSTPTDGATTTAISSDWAFDNVKTAVPANALFTDANTTYSAGTGLDLTGTTFSIEPDLRDGITKIGKDSSNYIAIDADDNNSIDFYVSGVWVARMEADGDLHIKGDVIAFSDIFNP